MPGSDLTEAAIRKNASVDSFQDGQQSYQQGRVRELVQRGNVLQAAVDGGTPEPYVVSATFEAGGGAVATCTCRYDRSGWCKHIVATLLAAHHSPQAIVKRPPLRDLLAGVDRDGLQTLLQQLVDREPALGDLLERDIALLAAVPGAVSPPATPPTPAPSLPLTTVDTRAIRRQVRAIHHGRGGSLDALLEQAQTLLAAGDGRNALVLLEALTDETVADESFERWEGREDWEDEPTGFFEALGPVWAEALLSTELTTQERTAWADKLEAWQETPAQYGYDDVFDVAIEAVQQGWDDPALQRVLQGQSAGPISRPRAVSVWGESQGDLTALRLAILDRQGRHEAYLHLAMAERRAAAYATMLVRLHRVQEAVDYGLVHLVTPDDALTLAQALWDRGEWQPAQQIAEHGMTLPGRKGALAPWLRDAAATMGDTVQALDAAVVMFKEAPSLPIYLQVHDLDPEGWPAHRADLLEHLRQLPRSYHPVGAVEIFLHEGLIDDAIAAVDRGATHTLVEQVVEAAIATHPDWVIKTARGQAEPFMDGGKAQYYGAAVRWLAHARDAYRRAGREGEWQAYHQELMALHGRKYKLVPMLQTLR